jgi:hypothetical protein
MVLKVGWRRRHPAGLGKRWGDERRLVVVSVVGNRWEPAAPVVTAVGRKGERREQHSKLGEGVVGMPRCLFHQGLDGQERRVIERTHCPDRRIPAQISSRNGCAWTRFNNNVYLGKAALNRLLYHLRRVQTRDIRLDRPAKDVLTLGPAPG